MTGAIHRWSSLISTCFLLLLCLTGLPLVFHEEIAQMQGTAIRPADLPPDHPRASFARIVETARAQWPGRHVQFVSREVDDDRFWYVSLGETRTSDYMRNRIVAVDARTAKVLTMPDPTQGFMWWMLRLHMDLFAGLPGKLLLGAMGVMMVTAIATGVALYAPFMRKLPFGTVRQQRGGRIRWLDLHNLVGIVTAGWLTVVGVTGVVNAWGDLIVKSWQADVLAPLTLPYRDATLPDRPVSLDIAAAAVRRAAPGMSESVIAFPGSSLSSAHHYAFFLAGDTPLTARLRRPVLVDARSGTVVHTEPAPWYLTAFMTAQPLHFGDYGGLPLKLLWGLFDLAAILVLGSGLYLWVARLVPRRRRAT